MGAHAAPAAGGWQIARRAWGSTSPDFIGREREGARLWRATASIGTGTVGILLVGGESRTNRDVASALAVSDKTASVHVSNILRKLHVTTRVQAAAVAQRAGLSALADDR